MNPSPVVLEILAWQRQQAASARAARQEKLHRAAVNRRRKAKNGGRR